MYFAGWASFAKASAKLCWGVYLNIQDISISVSYASDISLYGKELNAKKSIYVERLFLRRTLLLNVLNGAFLT